MAQLNLPEPQRQILRQMVEAERAAGSPNFVFIGTFAGCGVRFGRAQQQVEVEPDDLHLFAAYGLAQVRWQGHASASGILLPAAADLVRRNFELPDPPPSQVTAGVFNLGGTHHGSTQGAVGHGNRLNLNKPSADIAKALDELRHSLSPWPEPARVEAAETLDDVAEEASKPDRKPSRLRAYLDRLTTLARGAAAAVDFTQKLAVLAKSLGLAA